MDAIVMQALRKWPNVPACHGWLGLDARGRWYLRDDQVQAQGPFPQARGQLLEHEKLLAFIGRNYEADDAGCWFFQNGPQRVYAELEAAPWVWRLSASGQVSAHTGADAQAQQCLLDEAGRAYLLTDLGLGLVHSLDVPLLAQQLEQGRWALQELHSSELPARYGFVRSPAALQST